MVTDYTAADGPHNCMMAGVMPGYPTDYRTLQAPSGGGRTDDGEQCNAQGNGREI
jgi:hypothetical protein